MYKSWCQAGRPRDANSQLFRDHKVAEKAFRSKLKSLEKQYEDEKIFNVSQKAEIDKNDFWRLLKKERMGDKGTFTAIKNQEGKAVYDIEQVLDVWANHFDRLSTPVDSPEFDARHFEHVNDTVRHLLESNDNDEFTEDYFSINEIQKCIKNLNSGKSPGHDGLTKEHLTPAGDYLAVVLNLCFKWIFRLEYIPKNFRIGVQVPLHKGKNTSILDTNNFRGITLLSTFNKLSEMLIWTRMKDWWYGNEVISRLQGACRPTTAGNNFCSARK